MKRSLLALLLWPVLASAQPWWLKGKHAADTDFLPPDQAFKVSAWVDGNLIRVQWLIADGYYLYRSKFDISAQSPSLALDSALFPNGTTRTDEYFGTQEIYLREVQSIVGYRASDAGAHPLQIKVTYQGCAEAGLCYPLLIKVLSPQTQGSPAAAFALPSRSAAVAAGLLPSEAVPAAILGGMLAFFLAGLLLRQRPRATL